MPDALPGLEAVMTEARLFAMFAGWIMAVYGVRRRSWPGTIIAMAGMVLAAGAMTIGESHDLVLRK
jgi:hypothetical protein